MSTSRWGHWWWLLLILPALPLGMVVGGLPIPAPKAPSVVVHQPSGIDHHATPREPTSRMAPAVELHVTGPPPAGSPAQASEPDRAEISQWTSLDGALAESARNGKPVLIDFNAEWCGPCQRMKRAVFEDGSLGREVQTAVIPVSIVDRVRETGSNPPGIESLQQRYNITAFPTLVVFSPASGRMRTIKGFASPEATVQWIIEAAKAVR
jgi:thiol:disulfide interchange protein